MGGNPGPMTGGATVALLIAADADGLRVAAIGDDGKRAVRAIAHEQDLLASAIALSGKSRIDGIVVSGQSRRFSESRAVAAIANALGYAWRAPVARTSLGLLPDRVAPAILRRLLARDGWPIRPRYSGKPNITKPGKRSAPSAQRITLSA